MGQDIAKRTAFDEYVAGLELPQYAVPFEASPDFPIIKYAKNVTVISGINPAVVTAWHIAIEQSTELDNLFEEAKIPLVRVKHHGGKEAVYWQLDSISGYLMCKSVPSGYGPDAWRDTGVAYVWNDWDQKHYSYGSQLQCLFFLKGLLDKGYNQPLVLTFSHTVTEYFVQLVLRRQEAMLTAFKKALHKQGKPDGVAFYTCSVEMLAASKEITTKRGARYLPPVTTISSPLTESYIQEHLIPPAHLEIIENFIPLWDAWAQATSQRLLEPPRNDEAAQPTEPGEETPAMTTAQGAKQTENAQPVNDPTIIIAKAAGSSTLAIYDAVWRAKQRGIKGGLFDEEAEWWTLLSELRITEFMPADIGTLNKAITALLQADATKTA